MTVQVSDAFRTPPRAYASFNNDTFTMPMIRRSDCYDRHGFEPMKPFTSRPRTTAVRCWRIRTTAVVVLFGAALWPATARSQTSGTEPHKTADHAATVADETAVKELMRSGITEYRKNHFDAARAAFEAAWKLRHHTAIAASLADVEMKLGRFRDAAEHWQYYLASSPPDRAEAEGQLAECSKHVGRVDVTVEPAAATLILDGNATEREPPDAPLWLDPGEHTLSAKLAERSSPERKLTIAAGETQTVSLTVERPEATETSAPEAPTSPIVTPATMSSSNDVRPQAGNAARTWTVIGGSALTAAALGVGIGYMLDANALDDDAAQLRAKTETGVDPKLVKDQAQCTLPSGVRPAACDELRAKVNDANSARIVSIVGFASAGAFAAATVVTYFLWPSEHRETSSTAGLSVSPLSVGRGGTGLQIFGRF